MGSNHGHPVEVDPQTLQHSQKLWCNFTQAAKYSIIAIFILLGLMAAFLVH